MSRQSNMIAIELPVETFADSKFFDKQLNKCMQAIEDSLKVSINSRGDKIFIEGDHSRVKITEELIYDICNIKKEGYTLKYDDIQFALRSIKKDEPFSLKGLFDCLIPVNSKKKYIFPRTDTQRIYINSINKFDIVIGIGPAGTGKTYIAMAMAIKSYLRKEVGRIILARPAIEAGEKLGYLPGNLYEKVNPYLRPLYDALFDMMDVEKANGLIDKGIIEIAPLAYMRGRTLNDSFIILDEAQNTTTEQMKMYLTRLGFNSKTVITGDITQIDLPHGRLSGLVEAERLLKAIEGIRFVYFSKRDVVRHHLVQEIIKAYESFEKRKKEDKDQKEV